MPHGSDVIQPLQAEPEGLRAGFPVALAIFFGDPKTAAMKVLGLV